METRTKMVILSTIFVVASTAILTQVYPAFELTCSIAIRLLSTFIAIFIIVRYKDYKVAFLAIMFFLMAARQFLTLLLRAEIMEKTRLFIMLSEIPGFIVTILSLSSIIYIYLILSRLRKSNEKVAMLENYISICSYCKKIKSDNNWIQPEEYIKKHKQTEFSHGLCPECYKKEMEIIKNNKLSV